MSAILFALGFAAILISPAAAKNGGDDDTVAMVGVLLGILLIAIAAYVGSRP